jgi:RNA polymerase sigma factor (TIGR02999 family)
MEANITRLLIEAQGGDKDAQSRLALLVYEELHRIAARCMRGERPENSMQTTMLAHEAFIKLVGEGDRSWQNRSHFFAVSAQAMRRLLVDHARSRRAEKRGGVAVKVEWNETMVVSTQNYENWLAVDEALNRLSDRDPRLSRIVELRFFAGLTEEEIGEVLGISARQVKRDWRVAKAWLRGQFSSVPPGAKANDNGAVGTSKRRNG